MPRQPRYGLVGIPQLVFQRGNNRQAVFFAEEDYRHYLDSLREASSCHGCQVHAYVLVDNHVHLLITPLKPDAIAKAMQSVGRRYVGYFNDVYRRSGTPWEGRYRATLVDPENYVLTCYRFIELNPVRRNIAQHPGDYRWSSYAHHAGIRRDPLVRKHERYHVIGRTAVERHVAYRALFHVPMDPSEVAMIRETTRQCLVLGTERFKDQIEQALSRSVRQGKAGRPRKETRV